LSEPYRPYHAHDEKQALTPDEVYELDVEIWPTSLVVPAGYRIALSVRGRDYEYPKAGGDRLTTFKNELRGSGPFLHDDPHDRPPDVFGGTVTIHTGGDHGSYLLLPFVREA
jgi:predicted acyl esterase